MLGLKFNPWRSLTTKGALIGVGSILWQHFDPNGFGSHGPVIGEALGILLTVLGIRNRLEGPTSASP